MKKILLSFLSMLFIGAIAAQNNVQFTINHKLGMEAFELDKAAQNNMGHQFNTERLQYYIAEIAITHDESQLTTIENKWILVNAEEPTIVDLGEHPITTVESVHFHIGVNPENNHDDPATYPPTHPLAPTFPSMHWGWAAGYRFIAFEGKGGDQLNQTFELHGLGDDNYFVTNVKVDVTADNGVVDIQLDADYTRALEDIDVNSGVIEHGENGAAKQALENFRDHVFSEAGSITNTFDIQIIQGVSVFPNPSADLMTSIQVDAPNIAHYDLQITDMLGRIQQTQTTIPVQQAQTIVFEQAGYYLISIVKNGQTLWTEKVLIL